ncbi:MAG: prephenate dehydrogenase [Verrucomicrobiales bacterium]
MPFFEQITIIGPGALGGSLAWRCRELKVAKQVVVYGRNPSVLAEAMSLGVADAVSNNLGEAVQGADLVVLCTPVGVMPELVEGVRPQLRSGAIVTDVGSVRLALTQAMDALAEDESWFFVGSHPMAGTEQEGLSAARADLFEDSLCILTPSSKTNKDLLQVVGDFWRTVGCRLREMSPEEHDAAVCCVSHLPHALASALVSLVVRDHPDTLALAGRGWRDSTRVASGPGPMWAEILIENRESLRALLEGLRAELLEFSRMLEPEFEQKLIAYLEQAR